jgi:hypothetical protein
VDEIERKQKYEQQTEQVYAAIGRFAVKFEHVCHAMYSGVMNLLQQHGLQNQRLANGVLEGLTAEPLRRMFAATVAEVRGDQLVGDEKRIFSNVLKRIIQLTETRNDLIHRTWFVGWAAPTDEDFSTVAGWKFKNTNQGVEFRPLQYAPADFDSLSTQADELADIVNRLNGCLLLNRPFGTNFVLDADGTVRLPVTSDTGKTET